MVSCEFDTELQGIYINDFASVAKPLYRLTERGREFKWTSECSAASDELKSQFISAAYPKLNDHLS